MRYLAAALLSLFLAGQVVAGQCPSLVSQIDSQLASSQVGSDVKQQVKALRDEGEALHNQGKHGESVKVLKEALDKLNTSY